MGEIEVEENQYSGRSLGFIRRRSLLIAGVPFCSVDGATLAGVCWNIERIAVRDHFGVPWFSYSFVLYHY